jgi:hypothetical protein
MVHSRWVYSDNRFGFSIIENLYLDYLIVSNGSGLIYLEWVQNKAIWWFYGGSIERCTQTSFDFKSNNGIGISVPQNHRFLYFGGLNRSGMLGCISWEFPLLRGVLRKNPNAGIGKMSYRYHTSPNNLPITLH